MRRWRKAARATLSALLKATRTAPDADACLAFWRFADFFLLTRKRDFLLGPPDVWAALDADPDAAALRWAVAQLEPAHQPAEVGSEAETARRRRRTTSRRRLESLRVDGPEPRGVAADASEATTSPRMRTRRARDARVRRRSWPSRASRASSSPHAFGWWRSARCRGSRASATARSASTNISGRRRSAFTNCSWTRCRRKPPRTRTGKADAS